MTETVIDSDPERSIIRASGPGWVSVRHEPTPLGHARALQGCIDRNERLPAGRFTTAVPLRVGPAGRIQGAGREATIIDYRGDGYAIEFGNPDYISIPGAVNFRGIHLADIGIDGTRAAQGAGGVRIMGATRFTTDRVLVRRFYSGPGCHIQDYSWIGSVNDWRIEDCFYGLKATVGSKNSANQCFNAIRVTGGEIGPGCDYGIVIGDPAQTTQNDPIIGSGSVFHGVSIEGVDRHGLWIVEGNKIKVDACYFETNGGDETGAGHVRLGNGSVGPTKTTISDNWTAGKVGAGGAGIWLNSGRGVTVADNHLTHFGTGGSFGVRMSPTFQRARIRFNDISESVTTKYDLPQNGQWTLERDDVGGMWVQMTSGTHHGNGPAWRYGAVVEVDNAGKLILRSPNGQRWHVQPNDAGVLVAAPVT